MRVYEVLIESKQDQLDEGPLLNKIGKGIGNVVGTAAKGAGAITGGAVGIGQAFKKGYKAGKGIVSTGGDEPVNSKATGTTATPTGRIDPTLNPTSSAPAVAKGYSAMQAKKDADALIGNVAKVRSRDRQAVVDYVKQKLDTVVKAAAPVAAPAAKPAAAPVTAPASVKIPATKPAKTAAPKKAVSV